MEYFGASPSGKASDSDSDISGVRIPVPQPSKGDKKDIATKSLDFSRLFSFFRAKYRDTKMEI